MLEIALPQYISRLDPVPECLIPASSFSGLAVLDGGSVGFNSDRFLGPLGVCFHLGAFVADAISIPLKTV